MSQAITLQSFASSQELASVLCTMCHPSPFCRRAQVIDSPPNERLQHEWNSPLKSIRSTRSIPVAESLTLLQGFKAWRRTLQPVLRALAGAKGLVEKPCGRLEAVGEGSPSRPRSSGRREVGCAEFRYHRVSVSSVLEPCLAAVCLSLSLCLSVCLWLSLSSLCLSLSVSSVSSICLCQNVSQILAEPD